MRGRRNDSSTHSTPRRTAPPASRLLIYLRLGRVSNLPTVWTNVLAGVVLAGRPLDSPALLPLLLAFTLFYMGGMFLNDAFDRERDAHEQPERPIPSGLINPSEVFGVGYGLLSLGLLMLVALGGRNNWQLAAAGTILASLIVLYDYRHKGYTWAPLLMGLCRALVYLAAALAVTGTLAPPVVVGAGLLLGYVLMLTWLARQPSASKQTIGVLIAGISLLDALLILAQGHIPAASAAGLGFVATLALQRFIRGT